MGRTTPSPRIPVERELERLRRLARHMKDPQLARTLEQLLDSTYKILDAYRQVPMSDPLEPILIAMILETKNNKT
jgi:hypothetical protein